MRFWLFLSAMVLLPVSLQANASAKPMDMQQAMMASPMPNLMMLVMNNREYLALSADQLQAFAQWRQEYQAEQQGLTRHILNLQAQLHDLALEAGTQPMIEGLNRDLSQARTALIQVKAQCAAHVRKLLNPDQWQALMAVYQQRRQMMQFTSGSLEAKTFLRVSPFPKYMLVIIMHGHSLALTADQDKALDQWRIDNMNDWSMLFEQVHELEREITEKSFQGQNKAQLSPLYTRLLDVRREMEDKSMACADNMRKVLSDDQWQQVVAIYRAML